MLNKLRTYGTGVYDSIVRSNNRREVLLDLQKHGSSGTIEISNRTDIDYSNVRGVLIGNGKKFDPLLSLVNVSLVKAESKLRDTKYTLTQTGEEVASLIEQIWDS